MLTAAKWEREKQEVDALLASGIFDRAPNLALLLTYICQKYFDGQASAIKEYNLAVEALGRSPDFDQKRDSIVRVEIHRLRKRLQEYYDHDGRQPRVAPSHTDRPIRTEIHRPAASARCADSPCHQRSPASTGMGHGCYHCGSDDRDRDRCGFVGRRQTRFIAQVSGLPNLSDSRTGNRGADPRRV